jgi:hypothetical protein
MRVFLLFVSYISLAFGCNFANAQTPIFDSASDCADWFLISWKEFDAKYACAGRSTISGTQSEGFVDVDWFEVKFIDPKSREVYHYCENQFSHQGGHLFGTWERWCKRGKRKLMYALSDITKPMDEVLPAVFDELGRLKEGVKPTRRPPSPFGFAVQSPSGFNTDFNSIENAMSTWKRCKIQDLSDSAEGRKVAFFNEENWAMEVEFDDKVGGMPVFTRGYFRDKGKKGIPDRSFFSVVNYESKSKWKCLDEEKQIFVPVAVDNFVHRINSTSKHSKHLKVGAAWATDGIGLELFTDESLARCLDNDGPLSKLRKDLYNKLKFQFDQAGK